MMAWAAVKAWSRVTSIHGPPDVSNARNNFHRTLWISIIIVFAAIIGYCLGFFYDSYMSKVGFLRIYPLATKQIFKDNWRTTVTERMEELPFPYITICNFNRISKKKLTIIQLELIS